jgi:NAD(P)-dependent dehydrogenase (short-subunit alcohol dehydrogenase family)
MGQLQDKVVLVTGAGSGIGRASCLAFAREGARVVVADVNTEGGEKTVRSVEEKGGEAIFVKTDVTRAGEIEKLIDKTIGTYHRLDCAMNNAGILGKSFNVTEWDEEDWDRVMAVNLKSVWLCMKYELPHMVKLGKGAIVNTASTAGLVASMRSAAYSASKHGLVGLTKVAAVTYAKMGIRINALCPGVTDTPLIKGNESDRQKGIEYMKLVVPAGRMGTPEEQAEAALWLLSDAASYVIGHNLTVDGGLVVW